MKNFMLLLLFVSGFTFAQPAITNPTPLELCDSSNFGIGYESFDLASKNGEILGSLLPQNHTITYHETMTDANIGANSIPNFYTNTTPYIQTVYVRVIENSNPTNPSTTTLELKVNPLPLILPVTDYVINDTPFDGIGVFNLTTKYAEISQGSNYQVQFHTSNNDAQFGLNPIIGDASFVNTSNPQTIYVRISDPVTGCFSVTNFNLIVTQNAFPITDPTPLQLCDTNNDGFEAFDLTSKIPEVLGALNPANYTITFHTSFVDAQNEAVTIVNPTSYINVGSPQYVWIRVEENASGDFSITSLMLNVNLLPSIPTSIPSLNVYENPTDGIGNFNLELQTPLFTNGSPNTIVTYYMTLADAQSQSAQINSSVVFVGNHLQTIWVNVQNAFTGCFVIGSFQLKVLNSTLIVNIPDSNFKAKLLSASPTNHVAYSGGSYVKIDINNDLEIQFSEVAAIDSLNVSYANISDMTGIAAFTTLKRLDCSNNDINIFDATTNPTLIDLFCNSNTMTSLTVNGLSNLKKLFCYQNQITTLNLIGVNNLEYLNCFSNQIASLNVSNLNLLKEFNCESNGMNTITFGSNSMLTHVTCSFNSLSILNLAALSSLESLICYNNSLTTINVSQNLNLQHLNCGFNLITTLDCTANTNLSLLSAFYNPNLVSVFIKNGLNETNADSFMMCPSLNYICADESQIPALIASYPTATINSFCSFTPGGNYNTITGIAQFDENNNGCDAQDLPFSFLGLHVGINGLSTNSSLYTNNNGIYNLYTTFPGVYDLTPNVENPTYYNIPPITSVVSAIDGSTATANICITANGVHPDLEVVLVPITPARPGFDATYKIVYKNKGNQTLSGTITFNYNDAVLDFISSTVTPSAQTTGVITWNFTNLHPFENRTIGFVLNVNSPVETPSVNIGTVLNFTTIISPIVGDELPADNTFVYNQTVVGSYDPNDITCLQGANVSPSQIGNFLHYVINFENTGSYYAENVVVQDIIDASKYDISSLQILNASHTMEAKVNGNKAEFVFKNINLAATSGNPPVGGHGNVLFKIRTKTNLGTNDFVSKSAKIYFDYNAPIDTNIAQTTFTTLSNSVNVADNSITVYPNPTKSLINITSHETIESVELYDIQGRILEKSFQNSDTVSLDISNRQNGIYFIKITSEKGSKVEKIVKN